MQNLYVEFSFVDFDTLFVWFAYEFCLSRPGVGWSALWGKPEPLGLREPESEPEQDCAYTQYCQRRQESRCTFTFGVVGKFRGTSTLHHCNRNMATLKSHEDDLKQPFLQHAKPTETTGARALDDTRQHLSYKLATAAFKTPKTSTRKDATLPAARVERHTSRMSAAGVHSHHGGCGG